MHELIDWVNSLITHQADGGGVENDTKSTGRNIHAKQHNTLQLKYIPTQIPVLFQNTMIAQVNLVLMVENVLMVPAPIHVHVQLATLAFTVRQVSMLLILCHPLSLALH